MIFTKFTSQTHAGVVLITALLATSFVLPQLWLGEKYGGPAGIVAVLTLCILGFALSVAALRYRFFPLMRPLISALLFLLFATATLAVVYPLANARNAASGGSDSDEAIQIGVQRLLSGLPPYAETTYLGNPITPMPGTLLLYSPAHLAIGNVVWMAPILLGLAFFLLGKANSISLKALPIALSLSPLFWHNWVTGSDYIVIGLLAFGATAYLVQSKSQLGSFAVAVLLGLACASRPTMLMFPMAFLLLGIAAGHTRRALVTTTTVVIVAMIVTLPVYLWEPESFTPFHVVSKTGGFWGAVAAVTLVLAWQLVIFALIRRRKLSTRNAVGDIALLLGPAGFLLVVPPALLLHPFMLQYAAFTSMTSPLAVPTAIALWRDRTLH